MADYDRIVRDRQRSIRRQMDERRIAIKAVQLDGGWTSPSTVLSYFPADADREPATMSVASLFRLIETEALPLELLSLLLPSGFVIQRVPEGIDFDEYEKHCHEFLRIKSAAHHPASPAGREVSDCEKTGLGEAVIPLRAAG
ncbi:MULTISPECIES: hypothetical protein [Novosphingobium]|uniref:Uncharacterized protein n=2 Tax=Alphaproteobacteria TaxID=28211 RepID=G6E8S4_9SPHN|nr:MULTISPECIES: hypothetical protein [Novosphingobium]AIT81241.1 hypothetical protein JI59_16365 [Novosphingobium pentaromativorans US6-1]EHJ62148.1 hypothetical protein NSU_0745 [Novosphingobium pentaromativorans US6-1]BBA74397.1 hypothetical protein [Ochrobactrum sp. PW1]GFM29246.1 uncharacterized protein PY1_contig-07-172 [Novosphingobium sp. PY1]